MDERGRTRRAGRFALVWRGGGSTGRVQVKDVEKDKIVEWRIEWQRGGLSDAPPALSLLSSSAQAEGADGPRADPAVDRVLDAGGRRVARVLGALVVLPGVQHVVEHQRRARLGLEQQVEI